MVLFSRMHIRLTKCPILSVLSTAFLLCLSLPLFQYLIAVCVPSSGLGFDCFITCRICFSIWTPCNIRDHHAFTSCIHILHSASSNTRQHILTWVRNADCKVCDTNELSGLAATSVPVEPAELLSSVMVVLSLLCGVQMSIASIDMQFLLRFLRAVFL